MAKKNKVEAITREADFDGHIPKLFAYAPKEGTVMPVITNSYTGEPWVEFGRRNLWPEDLMELALNCGPLLRCMHTLAMLIAGNGPKFFTKDGKEIPGARDVLNDELLLDTTEEDFMYSCAFDIASLNAPSIQVRRGKGKGDIVRIDHLDVSRLRSGKLGPSGKPDNYYWSVDWARLRQSDAYKPLEIPRYQGDEKRFYRSVIYAKPYFPGRRSDEYAVPWWTGCINAAKTWNKVDRFNASQIDGGFTSGMHLHTFTNRPDDQLKKYDKRVTDAYTGSLGRALWHTYGTPGEGAPVLTPIPYTSYAGQLDEIRDGSASVIYSAYGMPGALVNELTKTGMDGASTALVQAKALVDALLVKPKQQLITKSLVIILRDKGLTDVWEARIDPIDLIDQGEDQTLAREAYLRSVKVDEYRESVLEMEPVKGAVGEKFLIEMGSKVQATTNTAP